MTPQSGGSVEQEMARIAVAVNGDVEVEVVNAGQEGTQFFACTIREYGWMAAVEGRRFPTTYGYGSGGTVLAAVLKAEAVMDNMGKRPQSGRGTP
jgi:hypothetical protein